MKVEWLYEARNEYRDVLPFYKAPLDGESARAFADKVLSAVRQLSRFPESGVLRSEALMGRYGFRALLLTIMCVSIKSGTTRYLFTISPTHGRTISIRSSVLKNNVIRSGKGTPRGVCPFLCRR